MSGEMKRRQRIYGIILIIICAVIVVLATNGSTPEEHDITAALFLVPLGISLIFSKKQLLYSLWDECCTDNKNEYIGGVNSGNSTADKIPIYPHLGGS